MDSTLSKIMLYFNDYLFAPQHGWQTKYALERSYERWAAGFIIDKILENRDMPGTVVIKNVILYFETAAHTTTAREQRYLFTTAAETANDILNTIEKEK